MLSSLREASSESLLNVERPEVEGLHLPRVLRRLLHHLRTEGRAWVWTGAGYEEVLPPGKVSGGKRRYVSETELLARYGGSLENPQTHLGEALEGIVKRHGAWVWIPLALEGRVWAFLELQPPEDADWTPEELALALSLFLQQEVRLSREWERLGLLGAIWDLLKNLDTPEALYREVVRIVRHYLQASTVLVSLYRPEEDVLEVVAGSGPGAAWAVGWRLRRGEGISWQVLEKGAPLYLPDARAAPQAVFFSGQPERAAYLGVPLRDPEGRRIGVLSVDMAGSGAEISPEDQAWVSTLAQVVGARLARLLALRETQKQAERYKTLLELSSNLEVLQDPLAIAEHALKLLLRLTPYGVGVLYRLEEGRIRPVLWAGAYPPEFPRLYDLHPVRWEEEPLGSALFSDRPIYIEDYARFPGALPPHARIGLKSILFTVLKPKGEPWGVMAVGSFGLTVPYRREDEALLFMVSARVEKALERALYVEEVQGTRDAVLEALARALEKRDLETKGHTDRVVNLALRLGEAVGFSDLEALRLGAFLHDIGKLALPDSILLKPGPLATMEWKVVKTHPEVGYEMLQGLRFLPKVALNVVLYHHERWDGSGYPKGLKGEEIPLEARLFAIVDVWDALLSERPYKKSFPPEEAKEELRRQAGKGLDPKLVEVFLSLSEAFTLR
ncbi:MAG: HD domain-containing phosphohydrolase [Thermaceae bacterium]